MPTVKPTNLFAGQAFSPSRGNVKSGNFLDGDGNRARTKGAKQCRVAPYKARIESPARETPQNAEAPCSRCDFTSQAEAQ
jgi:hypothetical protein